VAEKTKCSVKLVSYETCSLTVLGMDLTCPLCGVLVKSGSSHNCRKPKPRVNPYAIRQVRAKARACCAAGASEDFIQRAEEAAVRYFLRATSEAKHAL
jgi:hypothetical protein